MKKLLALAAVSLSVGLSLALNTPTTAHAAKWHQGTPKVLRGTWERMETVGKGKDAFKAPEVAKITKSKFTAYFIADPYMLGKLKYQKTGKHVYVFKGIETLYSHKPDRVRVHQVGKRLQWQEHYRAGRYLKMGLWLTKK